MIKKTILLILSCAVSLASPANPVQLGPQILSLYISELNFELQQKNYPDLMAARLKKYYPKKDWLFIQQVQAVADTKDIFLSTDGKIVSVRSKQLPEIILSDFDFKKQSLKINGFDFSFNPSSSIEDQARKVLSLVRKDESAYRSRLKLILPDARAGVPAVLVVVVVVATLPTILSAFSSAAFYYDLNKLEANCKAENVGVRAEEIQNALKKFQDDNPKLPSLAKFRNCDEWVRHARQMHVGPLYYCSDRSYKSSDYAEGDCNSYKGGNKLILPQMYESVCKRLIDVYGCLKKAKENEKRSGSLRNDSYRHRVDEYKPGLSGQQ